MATEQLLMGLGLAPQLASRLADATGNITSSLGTSSAPVLLRGTQFLVYFNTPAAGGNATIPTIGGSDNAPTLGDVFTYFNDTNGAATLGLASGVTLSIGGNKLTGSFTLAVQHFAQIQAVNSTQWIGASV